MRTTRQARVGRIFNARRPDRYPAAVLMARDDDDVINGVKLAAERGWAVSVRSGGHSWAAWSLHDDALLIDLGELRDITYDETSGVAGVRPAVKGGLEFAPFLADTRSRVSWRALRVGRARRLLAPGRSRLGRPASRLGLPERPRARRSDRRRRTHSRRREPEPRSAVGRPRCGSWVPWRDHALLPADLRTVARDVAGHWTFALADTAELLNLDARSTAAP